MPSKILGTTERSGLPDPVKNEKSARTWPQYVAGLSATLGGFGSGLALGWSSPAGDDGSGLNYPFDFDPNDFSWISSMFTLGAAAISVPAGMLTDLVGRRTTMLMMTIPFTIGWACVIWPNSVSTLVVGRFLLGLSGGSFSVIVPIYTGEIADIKNRGRLGSYLELQIVLGILVAYVMGLFHDMHLLSLISAIVPPLFFAIFFFMPESPTYHLTKGNEDAARRSLVWLRGEHWNVEPELAERKYALAEAKRDKISFLVAIRSRAALKGLIIGYGLMFFQQLSGINTIIFYGNTIFAEATKETSDWPIIVVGVMQVVAVVLSTLVVDDWGRRIPLFVSGAVMCVTSFVLAIFFYLELNENTAIDGLTWLPLFCIAGFVLAIEFGFGPIPWMMMGEIFSPQVKGVAGSSACFFNWLMAFVVTKFYVDVKALIGSHGAFFIFSGICGLSVVFVYFMVPETKGKTLEQIQIELGASNSKLKQQRKV